MVSQLNLGVTDAVSLDKATPQQIEATLRLDKLLRLAKCYESDCGVQLRIDVLSHLSRLFKNWVRQVTARQKNFPDSYVDKVEGKLYTFGSYRLGVNAQGADIDSLAVAPKHIERSEFFTSFVEVLSKCDRISEIVVADGAYVPIIKIVHSGVEIDIIFARLNP